MVKNFFLFKKKNRCPSENFNVNVMVKIFFLFKKKNRCPSEAACLLLSHGIPLRFSAETHGACDAGRGDPILDAKSIYDLIP